MFDSEGANGVLKVIDFGSSVFVQPNEGVSVHQLGHAMPHALAHTCCWRVAPLALLRCLAPPYSC